MLRTIKLKDVINKTQSVLLCPMTIAILMKAKLMDGKKDK